MKVLDPGHEYDLRTLDGDGSFERLSFVKREGEGYPGNVGHHSGTTTQEVLRALIDRAHYVDAQIPHPSNTHVLRDLRDAIWYLELRAAQRHGREDEFRRRFHRSVIETYPTCEKCNHVGCKGVCHD